MEPKEHWEKVYSSKAPTEVSWFQEHPELSLKLIRNAAVPPSRAGNFTGSRDRSPAGRTWTYAFAGYGDGYWGPAPVGSFHANAFGLYDMAGNVSEWVADCWHDSYRRAPKDDKAWFNPGCRTRVIRGGSWASAPTQLRSVWRAPLERDVTNAQIGFRVVRDL